MGAAGRLRAHRDGTRAAIVVRGCGFDFDHTLGIDNKLERVAFLRLLEDICGAGGRYRGTLAEEIARIDDLLQRQREGAFPIEDAVERFAAEHGIAQGRSYADRYKDIALRSAGRFVVAEPGVGEMLSGLRARNIPHAILTNGWSPLQERKAQCVSFEGPVLVSASIGAQKPSPAAFAALANALGLPVTDVAYVGDNPRVDVAGAISAGMSGIWFDAEGSSYPGGIPAPAAVIHSLPELLSLL